MLNHHVVAESVQAGDLEDDDVTAHILAGKVIVDSGSSLNFAMS